MSPDVPVVVKSEPSPLWLRVPKPAGASPMTVEPLVRVSGVAPVIDTVPVAVAPMRIGPAMLPPPAGGTGATLPDVETAAVARRTPDKAANTARAQEDR